jgi:hypothetical protein
MSFKTRSRRKTSEFEKIFIPSNSAALARTHRLIRIEKGKEIVFMNLCSQIHFDEFKKNRSELQTEERRQKRVKSFN